MEAASLRLALADTWAFYILSHTSHWNVRGPLFRQLHEFFGDIYEDAHNAVDGLAEELRALGEDAPCSPDALISGSKVQFLSDVPDARRMVSDLSAANGIVLESLGTAQSAASDANEQGLANYLQDRLNIHKKWGWMLDASLLDDVRKGGSWVAASRRRMMYDAGRK